MQENYYENVIFYDKYFIIDYKEEENLYQVTDFSLIFEINVKQAASTVIFFEKAYLADNSKLELGNTLFILQGENILIMDYDKNEINDEITIPYSRIHDYIISFSNILKHNGYIGV